MIPTHWFDWGRFGESKSQIPAPAISLQASVSFLQSRSIEPSVRLQIFIELFALDQNGHVVAPGVGRICEKGCWPIAADKQYSWHCRK
jgi:hypothetical protein